MKLKLLFLFIFLISYQTFAQDEKWSVEGNYSIIPNQGIGGNDDIIELGLKYRFADLEFVNFGLSMNAGYSRESFNDFSSFTGSVNQYYFQPRIFSEFTIPGMSKFHPTLALGYSMVSFDSSIISSSEDLSRSDANGGFNLNLGLTYDISEKFFIQAQYDFINLRVKDEYIFQGELVQPDFINKLNNIKIGVGFRF